jgi:hypothetical protein
MSTRAVSDRSLRPDGQAVELAPRDTSPFVDMEGERYYVVRDVDQMPPFLMSVVSNGDRWMFLSSSGGVTAGRRDATQALFPYETDDRLHTLGGLNGSVTAIRQVGGRAEDLWYPVTGRINEARHRTLYKSVVGDSVIFEEHDRTTGLTFSFRWASSDRFGFIRTATLANEGRLAQSVELIDGLTNILPHGLDPSLNLNMGNLANAYKRSEMIDVDHRFAIFSLESLISDRPEPAEALRATIAWSMGLDGASVSLHPGALRAFESGSATMAGTLVTGLPGAYTLRTAIQLEPDESRTWFIVADVGMDQPRIAEMRHELRSLGDPSAELIASMRDTSRGLVEIMARADGLQCTGDETATAHHFSNVTYNVMRGGIPLDGYSVATDDFADYLSARNRAAAKRHGELLSSMDTTMVRESFLDRIAQTNDPDLVRLAHEYLPFSFSRRHGDPSRPWNAFSIRVADSDGDPIRYYEGNWRDIFQNWEAMCLSFPDYLPDIVSVFVNASTVDGFNPYRLTSNGIDWEVPDPDDPWSNIGYWGDHQIIYLLRLLQASDRHLPGTIAALLNHARFAYVDVPYRMVAFERLVANPKATIEYDEAAAAEVAARVASFGGDGRLVWREGSIHHVTLAEKLIVPALAKLSNFVPGGGIWMNTQRPEWNDANNALVGHGLSMVTLYQLRSYLDHVRRLVHSSSVEAVSMSLEVADWLRRVVTILEESPPRPGTESGPEDRMGLVELLGRAFADYRDRVYRGGFSAMAGVDMEEVISLCDLAVTHLDATIHGSRRPDGLFQSYNLIHFSDEGTRAEVEHLGEMLEGQVAVIESGVLGADQGADIVDALFESDLYRADQESFMLYPARVLPSFMDRNLIPPPDIDENALLVELLGRGDERIVVSDVDGCIRFNAGLTTRQDLEMQLGVIADDDEYRDLIRDHGAATVRTYERVFGYHSYTGRSGSMYAYEGIGSIYWHMVAKLLVAIQASVIRATASNEPEDAISRLVEGYWKVRSGMGYNKSPRDHGAIPIDPYSHTPAHAGAQQPGMTGLVKEEILVRPAELGVMVDRGEIRFDTTFLRSSELVPDDRAWSAPDVSMAWEESHLTAGSLGMTLCQVPIIVTPTDNESRIEIDLAAGETVQVGGTSIGREWTSKIFARSGHVRRVHAFVADGGPPASEPGHAGESSTKL